jgi:hypothetical protein
MNFRGPTIMRGEQRHIATGDFVSIPAGVAIRLKKSMVTDRLFCRERTRIATARWPIGLGHECYNLMTE